MSNVNRYLKLVQWAKKRYANNGQVAVSHAGDKLLSVYSAIECAAFDKYLK